MEALRRHIFSGSFVAVFSLLTAGIASAQSTGTTRLSGLVSGSVSGAHAAPTVGLAASHELSRWLGVEGDFSHFTGLTLVEPVCEPADRCHGSHARASTITGNAILRLPGGAKMLPYLAVGGGIAFVRRDVQRVTGSPFVRNDQRPVVSAGGGVEFLVTSKVGVGLDLRYQRIVEDPRTFRPNLRNTKRVGTTVSYRF